MQDVWDIVFSHVWVYTQGNHSALWAVFAFYTSQNATVRFTGYQLPLWVISKTEVYQRFHWTHYPQSCTTLIMCKEHLCGVSSSSKLRAWIQRLRLPFDPPLSCMHAHEEGARGLGTRCSEVYSAAALLAMRALACKAPPTGTYYYSHDCDCDYLAIYNAVTISLTATIYVCDCLAILCSSLVPRPVWARD